MKEELAMKSDKLDMFLKQRPITQEEIKPTPPK
jgi:hypothetical protein